MEQFQELAAGGYVVGRPKSEAGRRVVNLPEFMIEELSRHVALYAEPGPTGRLFREAGGGPLGRAVFHRAWHVARMKDWSRTPSLSRSGHTGTARGSDWGEHEGAHEPDGHRARTQPCAINTQPALAASPLQAVSITWLSDTLKVSESTASAQKVSSDETSTITSLDVHPERLVAVQWLMNAPWIRHGCAMDDEASAKRSLATTLTRANLRAGDGNRIRVLEPREADGDESS